MKRFAEAKNKCCQQQLWTNWNMGDVDCATTGRRLYENRESRWL